MRKTILLIGTLDTKGREYAYVRDLIRSHGYDVLVLDVGILGQPPWKPDIAAEEVASAGAEEQGVGAEEEGVGEEEQGVGEEEQGVGEEEQGVGWLREHDTGRGGDALAALRRRGDRGEAIDVMIAGVRRLVPQLYEEGRFDGVLALGGGGGTNIATAAMRELPVGVPKVMVSTVASADVSPYVGIKDITLMYSVVDIAGLNPISRRVLANAAGAVCGMVGQDVPAADDRPIVAASMFGVTTPCVDRIRQRLEEAGFEVLVFHATGSGGRSMEGLIRDGYVAGVSDMTTTEWCDEVVGGILSAGPDRLTAAGEKGIPQVVSCGALDMVNFAALEKVPDQFRHRNLYRHNPNVTLMRTTPEECREIGRRIAENLNRATGPTVLMLPLKGVSMLDREGEPFHDPEADAALFEALREHIRHSVVIREYDLHINDPAFADAAAENLLEVMDVGAARRSAGSA